MTETPAAAIGELQRLARIEVEALTDRRLTITAREATLLLAHVSGTTEASVLAHPERVLEAPQHQRFLLLWRRRLAGEPMAYILGEREFYSRTFVVDRRVLVPRPETEHLVERVLQLELPATARLLDLATGSGNVALTLACERPGWHIVATDRSPAATALAACNRRRLGPLARVDLVCCDWLTALRADTWHAITCNPPYIGRSSADALSPEVTAWEPASALFGGDDGLTAYRQLLARSSTLPVGVPLVLELGQGQLDAVTELAEQGGFALRSVDRDLRGIPRVVVVARSA